jgi:hypothetical protein
MIFLAVCFSACGDSDGPVYDGLFVAECFSASGDSDGPVYGDCVWLCVFSLLPQQPPLPCVNSDDPVCVIICLGLCVFNLLPQQLPLP